MPKRKASEEEATELRFLEGVRRRLPDDVPALMALGDLYTKVGRFQEGFEIDSQLVRLQPDEPLVWYNLACSCALLTRADHAFDALSRAARLGYDDAAWMKRDPDLRSLHKDPRFEAFLKTLSGDER